MANPESKAWMPGQLRAKKLLAEAVTIDGRKERFFFFFLLRNERMDTVQVPEMSDKCSVGPAGELQADSLSKGRTVLIGVVFIEWRREQ